MQVVIDFGKDAFQADKRQEKQVLAALIEALPRWSYLREILTCEQSSMEQAIDSDLTFIGVKQRIEQERRAEAIRKELTDKINALEETLRSKQRQLVALESRAADLKNDTKTFLAACLK